MNFNIIFNINLEQNLITEDISSLLKKESENTQCVNSNIDKLARKIDFEFAFITARIA